MANNFVLDFYSSGSSQTIIKEQMELYPRLFQGSDLYIYNIRTSLFKVDISAESLVEIMPNGMFYVSAMTSVPTATSTNTIVFGPSTYTQPQMKYSPTPETQESWTSGSMMPTRFYAVDAESNDDGSIMALAGNSHSGTEPRVMSATDNLRPMLRYNMIESDVGIPQSPLTPSVITDIEIAR